MHCRYCASEEPDRTRYWESGGIRREMLIFNYNTNPGRCFFPSGRGEEGFDAAQTIRFTHVKSGFVVDVHNCFEQDELLFKAAGVAPQTTRDIEVFTRFFKQVIREKETRGRQPGQKDATPRFRPLTTSAAKNKKKILAAIHKLGTEPVYRKDVARVIGIGVTTLRHWVKDIGMETEEEWDDFVAEGLRARF